MNKRSLLISTGLCVILSGCAKEDPPTPETTLSSEYTTLELGSVTVGKLGSYAGVVYLDETKVEIHPHYNLEECVKLTSVMLSTNDWWNGILTDFGDSISVIDYVNYTIFTAPSGVTYGYKPVSDTEAIIAETNNLPSSYVKLVLDKVWLTGT